MFPKLLLNIFSTGCNLWKAVAVKSTCVALSDSKSYHISLTVFYGWNQVGGEREREFQLVHGQ